MYAFRMSVSRKVPARAFRLLWWAPALVLAGIFHFSALDRLPPGVCYDGATLACFASNLARGEPPMAGLEELEGIGTYRKIWSQAVLPASALTALTAELAGIPPERMERAELLFEASAGFLACLFLGILAWVMTGSPLLGAAALVGLACTPGHFLQARAGPHLFALPLPFWTGAALFLWLGREKGKWAWGILGWALVGLSGLFFYASLAGLPLFALLLTWFGAAGELGRREKFRRLLLGILAALGAYLLPAMAVGAAWGQGPFSVPAATVRFYLGQRGMYAPPGVPYVFLPFRRFYDLLSQVYGGDPPLYPYQAEVYMWIVPGRLLLPVTLQLLLVWAALRGFFRKDGNGAFKTWILPGILIQPVLVVLLTSGEIRYVAPSFAFAVLAGVLACRPPAGRGDPGPFGGVFLVLAVLLAAGEGAVTGFSAHAKNHWGVKPIYVGLDAPVKSLEEVTAGKDPGTLRVLCTWYPEIRYHLALLSDMRLCPYVGDLEGLLSEKLTKAIEEGKLDGKATPDMVLQGARLLGAAGKRTGTLWILGLSREARMKALGRWLGIRPWKTFPHPYGKGLQWWIYRIP